jgi:glycosyltransferase involved in cell wall biosynthesis
VGASRLRVLHLTPHLGGGVGTVLREYFSLEVDVQRRETVVVAIDTLNQESRDHLDRLGLTWVDRAIDNLGVLDELVSTSDVVLVHWWNHPLLHWLLVNHDLPPARVVFWSHISGTPAPNNFSVTALNYPDKFLFTTPLSRFVPEIVALSRSRQTQFSTVWSTAGVERLEPYRSQDPTKSHDGDQVVGYAGNLDQTKIHRDYLVSCMRLGKQDIRFQVIGPRTQFFDEQYAALGRPMNIEITGYLTEDEKFRRMSVFDLFGYPLARHHYATCDQALQEAMYLGAVPVVLNNSMESLMVQDGVTGLVCRSIAEYEDGVRKLLADRPWRDSLARSAAQYAAREYSARHMVEDMATHLEAAALSPKNARRKRRENTQLEPHEVYIDSLGNYGGIFWQHAFGATEQDRNVAAGQIAALSSGGNWTSPTKSTPTHYLGYFPEDKFLKAWDRLINGE